MIGLRSLFTSSAAKRGLLVACIALPLAGCETVSSFNPFGSAKATSDIANDEPAEALYNDALARLQNKNFDGAARKFQELDKQYPYTSWSRRSLLLQTYANYEQRKYEDAIQTGRRFVSCIRPTRTRPTRSISSACPTSTRCRT